MAGLRGRRLHCHYCDKYSRSDQPGIPRAWTCPLCQATNHYDERGRITDPPPPPEGPTPRYGFRPARAQPLPNMAALQDDWQFCHTCQHNHVMVQNIMAEREPDPAGREDDEEYRARMERLYPPICEDCLPHVHARIRRANYDAKAQHLERMLKRSTQNRARLHSPRRIWTTRAAHFAKYVYLASVVQGVLWHAFGILTPLYDMPGPEKTGNWPICLEQAVRLGEVHHACFKSATMLWWSQLAIIGDLCTFWWNPQIENMMLRPGAAMRFLYIAWASRFFFNGLRWATLIYLPARLILDDKAALHNFHFANAVMVALLLLGLFVSWKTVRLSYPTRNFMKPIDPYLPQLPKPLDPQSESKPLRPEATAFDNMGHSFTSILQNGADQPRAYIPDSPAPTPTKSSLKDLDDDRHDAYFRRRAKSKQDVMDWEPTTRRFSNYQTQQLSTYAQPIPQPAQFKQGTHSIFAQPETNPFRRPIPAMPQSKRQQERNPWKTGLWQPSSSTAKQNFFADMIKSGRASGEETGAELAAGPRNVRQDAELFKPPQFKYDSQGFLPQKTTGLEDTFNDVFKFE